MGSGGYGPGKDLEWDQAVMAQNKKIAWEGDIYIYTSTDIATY